jgi:hypothetical protein
MACSVSDVESQKLLEQIQSGSLCPDQPVGAYHKPINEIEICTAQDDASTPRFLQWKSTSNTPTQGKPPPVPAFRQPVNYAAQQREAIYQQGTSQRLRDTDLKQQDYQRFLQHRIIESRTQEHSSYTCRQAPSPAQNQSEPFGHFRHQLYELSMPAPNHEKKSEEQEVPPRPAPYPEDFEGLQEEDPIIPLERHSSTERCRKCGSTLKRRSEPICDNIM